MEDQTIFFLLGWTAEDRAKVLFHVSQENDSAACNHGAELEEIRKQKPRKKHKVKWMTRPMSVAQVLVELRDTDYRENALRALSSYLMQKLEDKLDRYYEVAFCIFHSFGTMAILIQELMLAYSQIISGELNVRGSKRLLNLLTVFQCVAANKETRKDFVTALLPNCLIPLICSDDTRDFYETVRMVALSVIGIVCQAQEEDCTIWALQNDIISVCAHGVQIGSELSKVISIYIIESILLNHHCIPLGCESELLYWNPIAEVCGKLVMSTAAEEDFSPRLLLHVMRCYILLTQRSRALEMLTGKLPSPLENHTFSQLMVEFPNLAKLRHQLLLILGKRHSLQPCSPN